MSFEVDTKALRSYSALLRRVHEDSRAVFDYFTTNAVMNPVGTTLLGALADVHAHSVDRAGQRTELMARIAVNSADEVGYAADMYDESDAAAERDLQWAGAHGEFTTPQDPTVADAAYSFQDIADPSSALTADLDPDQLKPKIEGIEQLVRGIGDRVSSAGQLRSLCKQLFGRDFLQEGLNFFAGNWQEISRCALTWFACMKSVDAIHQNVMYSDEALGEVWKGNAANASIGYFQGFNKGVLAEVDFFGYLYDHYRQYADISFRVALVLSDLLNLLLDKLALYILGAATGRPGESVFSVDNLWDSVVSVMGGAIWSVIGQIIDYLTFAAADMVHLFEIVDAIINIPDREPPCEMELCGAMNDPAAGYQHPDPESVYQPENVPADPDK